MLGWNAPLSSIVFRDWKRKFNARFGSPALMASLAAVSVISQRPLKAIVLDE